MTSFFLIDPHIILGSAALLGCFYFLQNCVEDAKTLLLHWQNYQSKARHNKQGSGTRTVFWLKTGAVMSRLYQQGIIAMCGPALPDDRPLPLLQQPPQVD